MAEAEGPGAPGLEVYCRKRERVQVKEAGEFQRTKSVAALRIYPEELVSRARELVLVLRPSMLWELDRVGALQGALAIWSLWRGYLEGSGEQRMQALFKERGVPIEMHPVSGHVYLSDLKRLVEAVKPERLVPIHTFAPERYEGSFPRVERHNDGDVWEI
jgi:ribonuclease J